MRNTCLYEKLALFSLALLLAIGSIYSYNILSILLPILTLLVIWAGGGLKDISLRLPPPLFFLLLLLTWIGMSVFWATNQIAALKAFISLTLTFTCSVFFLSRLMQPSPRLISQAYTLVKYAGFLLICFILSQIVLDTFFKGFLHYKSGIPYMLRMKPTGSILGLTAFVVCAFLRVYTNKFFSTLTFLLVFSLVILTQCQTAVGGMMLATLVFGLSYLMPFWITRIGMVASYTFLLLAPLFYTYMFTSANLAKAVYLQWVVNNSLFHRYLAWEYYSKKFFEKPFLGWGVESSRYVRTGPELAPGFRHLIHPHNNSIQAYAELGLIGGVLFALFFSSLFYLVEKHVKDRLSIAVCNATLVFGFVGAEITHGAWRNYWLSVVVLTAGLLILFIKAREAQLHARDGHLMPIPAHEKEWALQQYGGNEDSREASSS